MENLGYQFVSVLKIRYKSCVFKHIQAHILLYIHLNHDKIPSQSFPSACTALSLQLLHFYISILSWLEYLLFTAYSSLKIDKKSVGSPRDTFRALHLKKQ